MPRIKTERIGSSDLEEYLEGYSDFAFELAVLKMLRIRGLDCEHGGLYEDPVTKKSREFDIRAARTHGHYRVRFAIECKNVRQHFPLLVLCVPRHKHESYHQVALVSEPKSNVYELAAHVYSARALVLTIRGEHSIYPIEMPVGKSIAQVGRSADGALTANDREVHEKWGQALSSAHDLIERVYWDGDDDDERDHYMSTVVPFVVVPNGRLWTVLYDEDGNRLRGPELADRCSCYIGKDYEMGTQIAGARLWISHLELVTFDGLASSMENYMSSPDSAAQLFPEDGIADAVNTLSND